MAVIIPKELLEESGASEGDNQALSGDSKVYSRDGVGEYRRFGSKSPAVCKRETRQILVASRHQRHHRGLETF